MLIQFAVENFRSFRDKAILSMRAGRGDEQLPGFMAAGTEQVSRAAVLYGANASGKSNLVDALNLARTLITEGVSVKEPIPYYPFKLDPTCRTRPSRFEFAFVHEGVQYAYGFLVDATRVHAEWLFRGPEDAEEMLFERELDDAQKGYQFEVGRALVADSRRRQFYEFLHESTRTNELFLRAAIERNAAELREPFAWFDSSLRIISPEARFPLLPLEVAEDESFRKFLGALVESADTGIGQLAVERTRHSLPHGPPEWQQVHRELWTQRIRKFYDDTPVLISDGEAIERLIETPEGDIEIERIRLIARHGSDPVDFEIFEESDGTRRLMHLAPMLYPHPGGKGGVFIVDELERSLHPLLTRFFAQKFLAQTGSTNQLICTTHEDALLDVELLAPEAIWFVEKDNRGASTLYSLDEFNPEQLAALRDQKRSGYLAGRFGAIPFLGDERRLLPDRDGKGDLENNE